MKSKTLSHLDADGEARMVDVGSKIPTSRCAIAACEILMKPETLLLLRSGEIKKGDAFTVAKTAAFLAAKKTSELIPLCHPLVLDHIDIRFLESPEGHGIMIESEIRTVGKTGVEMEALTAASIAALTIYDMAKAVDPGMKITNLRLVEKTGGKSDYFT